MYNFFIAWINASLYILRMVVKDEDSASENELKVDGVTKAAKLAIEWMVQKRFPF